LMRLPAASLLYGTVGAALLGMAAARGRMGMRTHLRTWVRTCAREQRRRERERERI
jgi:hypothetical protein